MGAKIRKLAIQADALDDFRKLVKVDREVAAEIVVFLEDLAGDQHALECLADDAYENKEFNVSGIKSWWRQGFAAWRVRALVVAPDYRVFYAAVNSTWVVLGVQKRRKDLYEDVDLRDELRRRLNAFRNDEL